MSHSDNSNDQIQVLVVDDDAGVRKSLSAFLKKRGCGVLTAPSGEAALERLRSAAPALIFLDVSMPGMSGIEVLEVLPETVDAETAPLVIMVTGEADASTAALCMQRGAMDYLLKPFELEALGEALERALKKRAALLEQREASAWLQQEVARSAEELEVAYRKLQELTVATLDALIGALEAKSPYLAGHSARVAALAATVAAELGLDDDDIERVRAAGRLHDLGMIGIRESVIDKKEKLTDGDFAHIREHVEIGVGILQPFSNLSPIVDMVRTHHENWDGSGYPQGLEGEASPVGGRIIRAAEVYDAVTTQRPYQPVMTPEEAVAHMRSMAGRALDPNVVSALDAVVGRRQALVFIDEE